MANKRVLSILLAFTLLLTSVSFTGMNFASSKTVPDVVNFTIIHTNDTRGKLKENTERQELGYSRIKSYCDSLRMENKNVLLLDAGNTFYGDVISNTTNGDLAIKVMNEMNYTAMVPGNMDFNYSYEKLVALSKKAKFPVVASNLQNDNKLNDFKPYVIKDVGGIKVGIFGLVSNETKTLSAARNTERVTFLDNVVTAQAIVKDMKSQGVTFVIALTSLGPNGVVNANSKQIAEQVDGVDLIIDGHEGIVYDQKIKNSLIVQTGKNLNNIGRVDVVIQKGVVSSINSKLIPYSEASHFQKNADIEKVIETHDRDFNQPVNIKVVGENKVELVGKAETIGSQETNLGDMVADAILREAKRSNPADFALVNAGLIKSDILVGPVKHLDVIKAIPSSNLIKVVAIKGSDVEKLIEYATSDWPDSASKFPQVSGISFVVDGAKPAGSRVKDIKIANQPIDYSKTYKAVVNSSIAEGLDGFTILKDKKVLAQYGFVSEAVEAYIEANKPLSYTVMQRIKFENAKVSVNKPAAANTEAGIPSNQTVKLNGKVVGISAYQIKGENYFKLRDMAAILANTKSKFNVDYDKATSSVLIVPGVAYVKLFDDLKILGKEVASGTLSTNPIKFNGKPVTLKAYMINGSNYFRLRDLGTTIGFTVGYDAATSTVLIDTK